MIFIAMAMILILFQNYEYLGKLLNPGFTSLYDKYIYRAPFVNNEYYINLLKNENIRDGLFGELTTELQGYSGPVEFTYAPFWVAVNRWLMAILLIAIILLVINRILVLVKILPEYIADIPVYGMTILSVCGYYLSVKVLGDFSPVKAGFHAASIVLVLFSVFAIAIAIGIMRKRSVDGSNNVSKDKSEKNEEEDKKRKKKLIIATIVLAVQVLLFIILPSKFMIDAFKINQEYKAYYGSFNPEKIKVRYDLEKNGFVGNFTNQAVDTGEGLYFIENETRTEDYVYDTSYIKEETVVNTTHIRKLDENGNITDICPVESVEKEHYYKFINIGYADGYLYASTWCSISRIDPADGSEVEVISASKDYYIAEMCVVDNKLYYMELPLDYQSGEKSFAWVCEIEGSNLSEPELYISGLYRDVFVRFSQYESSSLLIDLVVGDYIDYPVFNGGKHQKYDGKYYCIERGSGWGDDYKATWLLIANDGNPGKHNYIDDVGGFTLYNDSIYFVKLKENGFDLCKSDLEGSNIEVLDTYTCDKDLSKNYYQSIYSIMIGQGKIYVSAIGKITADEDFYDNLDLIYDDIRFVTDLK